MGFRSQGFVASGLSRMQHSVFARASAAISGNQVQAAILNCDFKDNHAAHDRASEGFAPVYCSMGDRRGGAALGGGRAAPSGCAVDRSADDGGARSAPLAGLDSSDAVPEKIQIRSAEPDLA